ncbi:MAG: hypothetical protein GY856_28485 [bacterium]|nr:hypothetical protein [bacterium]
MAILNQEDAYAIARKLRAEIVTRRKAHDLALVYHEDVVVAKFGIRRGRKDLGHDHIMADIFLSPHDASRLAGCSMTRNE